MKTMTPEQLRGTRATYTFDPKRSYNENVRAQDDFLKQASDIYFKAGIQARAVGSSNISRKRHAINRIKSLFRYPFFY